eukprot:PhM_4_TR8365/c0_g1_i2/m.14593
MHLATYEVGCFEPAELLQNMYLCVVNMFYVYPANEKDLGLVFILYTLLLLHKTHCCLYHHRFNERHVFADVNMTLDERLSVFRIPLTPLHVEAIHELLRTAMEHRAVDIVRAVHNLHTMPLFPRAKEFFKTNGLPPGVDEHTFEVVTDEKIGAFRLTPELDLSVSSDLIKIFESFGLPVAM